MDCATEKKIVGKLIGFYRKKVYKYTQKQVVFNQNSLAEYCDVKTLAKIEKGYISANDDFYIDICSNLHMEFELSRKVLLLIEDMYSEQLALLEHYSRKKSYQLYQQILVLKNKYKKYVYINELLLMLESMNQLFSDFKPLDEYTLEICELIAEDLTGPFQQICVTMLMFHYIVIDKHLDRYLLYRQIYLESGFNKTISFEVNETLLDQNILSAYRRLNSLESQDLTALQKYILLANKAIVQNRMRLYDDAIVSLEGVLLLYQHYPDEIPVYAYERTMKRLAIMYYYKGQYERCLNVLKELMKKAVQLNYSYLLLFEVMDKLNCKEEIKYMVEERCKHPLLSAKSKMMLSYYEMKFADDFGSISNCRKLENLIVENLVHYIYLEPLMVDICHKELTHCVSITSDYKMLFLFEQKIKKLKGIIKN